MAIGKSWTALLQCPDLLDLLPLWNSKMGPCIRWGSRYRTGRGIFEGGHVPAHCNVVMQERIVSTEGKCACPVHAADKCISQHAGWKRCDLLPKYFRHLLLLFKTYYDHDDKSSTSCMICKQNITIRDRTASHTVNRQNWVRSVST